MLNLEKSKNIMTALYKGFVVTAITSLIILYPLTDYVLGLDKIYTVGKKRIFWFKFILLWCNRTCNYWFNYLGD